MNKVHKSELRPWISKKINVKQFQDDWWKILSRLKVRPGFHSENNLSEDSEMERQCGLNAMKCEYQERVDTGKNLIIPENVDLLTLRLQKDDLDRRKRDTQYESVVYSNSKFLNYPINKVSEEDRPSTVSFSPITQPDVLLSVQIFRPEKRYTNFIKNQLPRLPVFQTDFEFMVLGSQCLTELRDKIECVSDLAIPGDFSEMPDLEPEITCKDLYKSGFFYINGVFYNDMRHSDCRNYSKVIIDWANQPGREMGPFSTALMEKTKFIDLEIQLGYPYVYAHQGNCEHLIVFNDLLMYSTHYCENRNQYPLFTVMKPKKRVLCMVCKIIISEWVVFDSKRVPETPFYFCKACFFSYNYDGNNQKIGEFRAYHHIDRSSIM